MSNTATTNEYLKTKVMTAAPEQLTMMLYDGVVRFAEQGREAIINNDYEGSYTLLTKAQNIVSEFLSTLKDEVDPELCGKMRALYMFCYERLIMANLKRDLKKLDEAIKILNYMRETWSLLLEKIAKEGYESTPESVLSSGSFPSAEEILEGGVGTHICLEG